MIARDNERTIAPALEKLGWFDQSIAAYRRSIDLRPHFASTHLNLGYALRGASRRQEAVAAWRQALETTPPNRTPGPQSPKPQRP